MSDRAVIKAALLAVGPREANLSHVLAIIDAVEPIIRAGEAEEIARTIEAARDRYLRGEDGALNGNQSGAMFYTDAANIAWSRTQQVRPAPTR